MCVFQRRREKSPWKMACPRFYFHMPIFRSHSALRTHQSDEPVLLTTANSNMNAGMHPDHIIIAGAQKCGTTTLYGWLANHPEISTATGSSIPGGNKELRFFGSVHWPKGFDWYHGRFTHPDRRCLDATPEYLCCSKAAEQISRVFPDVKIIVTLRDPVDRAISQFRHYSQDFPRTQSWDWRCPGESLETNLKAEFAERFDRWRGILGRGLYAEQLAHLTRFISREQIFVLILEEWQRQPRETYDRLVDFLQLRRVDPEQLDAVHRRSSEPVHLSPDTLASLQEFFREPNEALFSWFGRSIPSWVKSYSHGS